MLKLALGVALSVAAYGAVARPGTINYTEGNVTINGRSVASNKLGSIELSPGRQLETANGKAEMLLTPGVFLRLGDHSAVRMVSPSLTDTRVDMVRGRATLEVDMLAKENHLAVRDGASDVAIIKKGVYEFNADQPKVAVYDGKVQTQVGDKSVDVGKGKELPLDGSAVKPRKFDRKETDDLMAWSKLRSQYVAEANAASAQTIFVDNPAWYAGTGWYWNPWFDTYAFVPGAGYMFNPWGYGFYSPSYFYYNPPIYGGYYGGGYYGGGGGVFRGVRPVHGGIPGRVGTGTVPSVGARPVAPVTPTVRPAPIGGGGGAIRMGGMGGGVRGGRR